MNILEYTRGALARRVTSSAVLVFLALGVLGFPVHAQSQEISLKFANVMAPAHDTSVAVDKFVELTAKHSGGRLKITHFPGAQLGSDKSSYEAAQQNLLDIGGGSTANIVTITRAFDVLHLPYIFNDRAQVLAVLDSPKIRERINVELAKVNLHWFLTFEYGFRAVLTTKKEVIALADMKGLRFRASRSPLEIAAFEAFGARAVTIDWPEVYQALKTGIVDGEAVNLATAISPRHHELLKFALDNGFQFYAFIGVMSLEKWKKLPQWARDAINQSAREAQTFHRALWSEEDAKARRTLTDSGIKITVPTAEQKRPWVEAGRKVWANSGVPKDVINLVLEEAKRK